MKRWLLGSLLLAGLSSALAVAAQEPQSAKDMQSASPEARPGESEEQRGRRLLAEMVTALGGDAWLHKKTEVVEGQTAAFFRGEPTGSVVRFVEFKRFADGSSPEMTRVEFVTGRGMITPGTKRDVVHLWTADNGYEVTFKGRTTLPAPQVADYMRRRAHTLEEVMEKWVNQPGVVVVAEGAGMRDRRPVDKVSILTANNDAVEVEIEQGTHLPLQRSFEWRNQQFKDHDVDEEVYGDWRMYDGIATPMNLTRYRNGDMVDQTFYTRVKFNQPVGDQLFDLDRLTKK